MDSEPFFKTSQVLEAIKTMTLTTPSVQAVVMDFEQGNGYLFTRRQHFGPTTI